MTFQGIAHKADVLKEIKSAKRLQVELSYSNPMLVNSRWSTGPVSYHRANELICPSNITLLSLPPYPPESNPVEDLWHDLRSHHWSNRKYDTVDDLFEAAVTAWRATCLDPNLIRTVCRAPCAKTRS